MPRTYGEKFLRELSASQDTSIGIELARVCVQANLSVAYVAKALNVSDTTMHNWFRGLQNVSEPHRKLIEVFISVVDQDTKNGRLPANSIKDAKNYIQELIGRDI